MLKTTQPRGVKPFLPIFLLKEARKKRNRLYLLLQRLILCHQKIYQTKCLGLPFAGRVEDIYCDRTYVTHHYHSSEDLEFEFPILCRSYSSLVNLECWNF